MMQIRDEVLVVVVVDDDPVFREIACAALKANSAFVVFDTGSGDGLLEILSRENVDCIMIDYDLGVETGLSVKKRVEDSRPDRVPMIMLTGDGRESTAIRAFRMGISDYIPKRGLRSEDVIRTVCEVVERYRRGRAEDAERERLQAGSSIDATTGLETRTRLDERLSLLAGLPRLASSNYALILIEIVDYAVIVGRFGFKTGDKVLRTIAKRLSDLTRSGDVCGRYELGTFLVIANVGSDVDLLRRICSRFSEELVTRFKTDVADVQLSVRVVGSIGMPENSLVGAVGDENPILRPVKHAMQQARISGATVVIAADLPEIVMAAETPCGEVGSDAGHSQTGSRPAAEELRSEDRRKSVRKRVLRRGLIHNIDKQSTINCTIRNQSLTGMGLRLEAPCAVPDVFDIEVIGSGVKNRVQLRWQMSRDLGVELI